MERCNNLGLSCDQAAASSTHPQQDTAAGGYEEVGQGRDNSLVFVGLQLLLDFCEFRVFRLKVFVVVFDVVDALHRLLHGALLDANKDDGCAHDHDGCKTGE